MYTEKELLKLSGKLAVSCENVLHSNLLSLSDNLNKMRISLMEYNNAIMENVKELSKIK